MDERGNERKRFWDLRDAFGNRTGQTVEAGSALPDGVHRLCVDLWVKRADGAWLLRSGLPEVQTPGAQSWSAFHDDVFSEEDAMQAAVRIALEAPDDIGANGRFERLFRSIRGACVVEVICLHIGSAAGEPSSCSVEALDPETTDEWHLETKTACNGKPSTRWATFDEIVTLAEAGRLFPYGDNYLTCVRMGRPMLRSARSRNGFTGGTA